MGTKPEEKDILGQRGAAVAAVFFVSGPLFFFIWAYLARSDTPLAEHWAIPIVATLLCSICAFFLPERMLKFVGNLLGLLIIPFT